MYSHLCLSVHEKYRDPGRRPGLGCPSRTPALAKLSLSKLRTRVVSNLLYSSTRNCTKTLHSSKLSTPEPAVHSSKKSTKIQIFIGNCPLSTVSVVVRQTPHSHLVRSAPTWPSRETPPTHSNMYITVKTPPPAPVA